MAFSIKKNLDKIDLMSNIRGTHQIIDSVGQHFQRKKELARKIHALSNVFQSNCTYTFSKYDDLQFVHQQSTL